MKRSGERENQRERINQREKRDKAESEKIGRKIKQKARELKRERE